MSEDVMTASTALSIEKLGRLIAAKRGGHGVRAAAMDVGVSPATLSRVENGHMPDLETFAKICRWLGRDPREFLGLDAEQNSTPISDRLSDDILAELDRQLLHWHEPMLQRARDEIVALRKLTDGDWVWQQITNTRTQALEEAAQVCERMARHAEGVGQPGFTEAFEEVCATLSAAIRLLKHKP